MIADMTDRIAIYKEGPRRLYKFIRRYPIFPEVIADLLLSGMSPEEITLEVVEKQINESEEYRMKNLNEIVRPSRRINHWEFVDDE